MATRVFRVIVLSIAVLTLALLAGCSSDEGGSGTDVPTSARTGTATSGDVPGVSDTEIKLGTHMPLSQTPAAAYAIIADGIKAYFDYVNANGGVHGRRLELVSEDDFYEPARAPG